MRRATAEEQTRGYLASGVSSEPKRVRVTDKRAIDNAINRLNKTDSSKVQIEMNSETIKRLICNRQISLDEIQCLNKSSKDRIRRYLLKICRCI